MPSSKPRGLIQAKRARLYRYLMLGWTPEAIACEVHVSVRTVQRYRADFLSRCSTEREPYRRLGRPRKLTVGDEEALLEHLLHEGWMYIDEMAVWLQHERDVVVAHTTISNLLKRRKWSKRMMYRITHARSDELHTDDSTATSSC